MKIRCTTKFDITATGVTGHCKPSRLPFTDASGQTITSEAEWNRARNQQRNLETITQILQLRTQIFDQSMPVEDNGYWSFTFNVEFEGIYRTDNDEFSVLKQDCEGVPMLVGLDEEYTITPLLTTDGSQQNIWFELIAVNN